MSTLWKMEVSHVVNYDSTESSIDVIDDIDNDNERPAKRRCIEYPSYSRRSKSICQRAENVAIQIHIKFINRFKIIIFM